MGTYKPRAVRQVFASAWITRLSVANHGCHVWISAKDPDMAAVFHWPPKMILPAPAGKKIKKRR
jgi:hypothetical protein